MCVFTEVLAQERTSKQKPLGQSPGPEVTFLPAQLLCALKVSRTSISLLDFQDQSFTNRSLKSEGFVLFSFTVSLKVYAFLHSSAKPPSYRSVLLLQKKIHFFALLLILLQIHSNYLILYHNQSLRHQHRSTVASCSINTFANGVVCKLQWSIKYIENIVGVTVLHPTLIPPKHKQTGWSWFAPSPATLYKPEKPGGFSPSPSELQS